MTVLNPLFWESRLGADRSILGKTVRLNGRAFTVVGVAERTYSNQNDGEVYIPVAAMTQMVPGAPSVSDPWRGLSLRGRLKPGVSVEQAQSELTALLREIAGTRAANAQPASVAVLPGGDFPGKRRELLVTMISALAIVGMILLIACVNTANLLMARAAARRREIGVRLSVGASRRRLIQQLLTESLVLAGAAGSLGLLLSTCGEDSRRARQGSCRHRFFSRPSRLRIRGDCLTCCWSGLRTCARASGLGAQSVVGAEARRRLG